MSQFSAVPYMAQIYTASNMNIQEFKIMPYFVLCTSGLISVIASMIAF